VATRDAAGFRGVTVTSFISLSLEPPQVLLGLDRLSAARDALLESRVFTASLLSSQQAFLADRFSGQAPVARPDWADVPHRLSANGLPIVAGVVAWFECAVVAVHQAGDHDAVIGSVGDAGVGGGEPLVHWERGYWSLRR
jgi:flavin reductase (DIM6/NTAB) family NADH-FMN oxidoreductase RutF